MVFEHVAAIFALGIGHGRIWKPIVRRPQFAWRTGGLDREIQINQIHASIVMESNAYPTLGYLGSPWVVNVRTSSLVVDAFEIDLHMLVLHRWLAK